MKLTKEQLERYSRQIVLPEIGSKGQKKLLTAKVLIIGCGGLGSSCAYYLTAAGVGNIGLVDADVVSLDNLQRQILHFSADIGKPKVESAKEKLRSLNPTVRLNTYHTRITSKNVIDIIKNYDVIIDST
ncbi:MAG: HesA/MoeB/ThiF family protein, partial [Endomicrobia bacterium]|nr:HesA/MoeB/ThiF family protein [Endomicrobiia bacterium]